MPVRRTKAGGYRYGRTGKIYYGKNAKLKALKQGQAIEINKKKKRRQK